MGSDGHQWIPAEEKRPGSWSLRGHSCGDTCVAGAGYRAPSCRASPWQSTPKPDGSQSPSCLLWGHVCTPVTCAMGMPTHHQLGALNPPGGRAAASAHTCTHGPTSPAHIRPTAPLHTCSTPPAHVCPTSLVHTPHSPSVSMCHIPAHVPHVPSTCDHSPHRIHAPHLQHTRDPCPQHTHGPQPQCTHAPCL